MITTMMTRRSFFILVLTGLTAISCQSNKENRMTEDEIRAAAIEAGNQMAMKTQQVLGSTLKSTIQQEGIPQALKYCNVHAYPLVDSLEESYDVTIRRASSFTRNPDNRPDKEEMEIILDYLADLEAGRTPEPVVEIKNGSVFFAKPIILSDQVCLNCHGLPGEDVKDENLKVIQALYPDDKATGHRLGGLRGIWSISFKKDNLMQMTSQ